MNIEEVLLILNSLVYSNKIDATSLKYNNVYDLVDKGKLSKPDDMIATQEEWDALLNIVK